jgi:hypothetical protein
VGIPLGPSLEKGERRESIGNLIEKGEGKIDCKMAVIIGITHYI